MVKEIGDENPEKKEQTPSGAFRLASDESVNKVEKEGTWFEIPARWSPPLRLKIRFIPPSTMRNYRKSWTYKQRNPKTHQLDEIEDNDKKIEASMQMIYDAVTDWDNVYDEKTNEKMPFSTDGFKKMIEQIALAQVDDYDEEGERRNVSSYIVKCMTDSEGHFGEKKN